MRRGQNAVSVKRPITEKEEKQQKSDKNRK